MAKHVTQTVRIRLVYFIAIECVYIYSTFACNFVLFFFPFFSFSFHKSGGSASYFTFAISINVVLYYGADMRVYIMYDVFFDQLQQLYYTHIIMCEAQTRDKRLYIFFVLLHRRCWILSSVASHSKMRDSNHNGANLSQGR